MIEKVTALITRKVTGGEELLLFRHPHAGIQIPAGTVEAGETPEIAVLREAREETGLSEFAPPHYLGHTSEPLPEGQAVILEATPVYARPDRESVDWAYLRRGITVARLREVEGFCQVRYEEFDRVPEPQYSTLAITGWVPEEALADIRKRYFFHLAFNGETPEQWVVRTDHHQFTLFWAPLAALPEIIPPQDEWLAFL